MKFMIRALVLAVAVLLSSFQASAQLVEFFASQQVNEITDEVQRTLTLEIDSFLRGGRSTIGNLDLNQLKREIRSVRVYRAPRGMPLQVQYRNDGINFPGLRRIVLGPNVRYKAPLNPEEVGFLVHEFFGALGSKYSDADFQISTIFAQAVAQHRSGKSNVAPIILAPKKYETNVFATPVQRVIKETSLSDMVTIFMSGSGGGTTSVPGGGDITSFEVKQFLRMNVTVPEATPFQNCTLLWVVAMTDVETLNDREILELARVKDIKERQGILYLPSAEGPTLVIEKSKYQDDPQYRVLLLRAYDHIALEWMKMMQIQMESRSFVFSAAKAKTFMTAFQKGGCYELEGSPAHVQ